MSEHDSLVLDLVVQWEEAVASGRSPELRDICREHPHLISEVQEKIAVLKSLTPVMSIGSQDETAVDELGGARPDSQATSGEVEFVVGKVHARGGLGEIALATDKKLNRPVAVKRMREHCRRNAGARRRFLREAEITGQLQHPGVAPVYGFARDAAGDPVYAMRFVEGITLQQAVADLHSKGPPGNSSREFRQLLSRLVTVCQTIAYAHSKGIVHRDLKPANIMLGAYGETVVLDWGLAKRVGRAEDVKDDIASIPSPENAEATRAGDVLGTPAFMSPEQAVDSSTVSEASDVYSLGAILYVVLTGDSPFAKGDRTNLLDRVRRGEYPPPRSNEPTVPRALEAICLKAMAKEPAERYKSAAALADDIERWQSGDVPSSYRENVSERIQRWARRHRMLMLILTAAILTGGIAATVGAGSLYREQKATATERDRADANYQLADQTASEMVTAIIENPRLKEADFHHTRRDILRQTMPLYEKLVAQKPDNEQAQFHQAGTLFLLGQIHHELGEESQALARMIEAKSRMEPLVREHSTRSDYALLLARCEQEIGTYLYFLGRLEEAQGSFLQARDRLSALSPTAETSYRLARVHNNLGLVRHSLGNLPDAKNDFLTAIAWQSTAPVGTEEHDRHLAFRANTLSNYSILLRDQFDYPGSIQALRDAIALQSDLANRHPDLTSYQIGLAKTELNLAGTLRDQRQSAGECESLARGAIARYEVACKRLPAVPELRLEQARAQNVLAGILENFGKVKDADRLRTDIIATLRKLEQEHADQPEFKAELATVLFYQGTSLMNQGENAAAGKSLEEALALFEAVLRVKPNDAQAKTALRQTLNNFGNLHFQSGKLDAAEKMYRREIEMLRKARAVDPNDPALIDAEAAGWMNLGNIASGRGDFAGSLTHFTEGIKLGQPILERYQRKHTEAVVRNCHWGMADSLLNLARPGDSIAHWDEMLKLIQSPKERAPFRVSRALALARVGRTDEAVTEVGDVADQKFLRGESLAGAASVYSLASAKAADEKARESHQLKAIELLRAAKAAGVLPPTFPDGADFAPLRQRSDFPVIVAELKSPPKKK